MKLTQNKKVTFDEWLHCYVMGDNVLMGITSLMKKHGLGPEYGDVDEDTLAAAAARGTAVHKTLEAYDNGEQVVFTDTLYNGRVVLTADELKANLDAYRDLGLKAIASEFLVSDNKLVASSIDKILDCGSENEVDLGDVKTTYTLHIGALEVQLGCYKYLLEKQCRGKIKVRKCYGIHVRKGKAVLKEITPWPAEKVEALLLAEAEGRIYSEEKVEAVSVLNEGELTQWVNAESNLAAMKATIKSLEESTAEIREKLYQHMIDNNLTEMACPGGAIVLKRPSQRTSVDSKKLQSNYPDIYKECTKVSEVKGSISFKPSINESRNSPES